MELYAAGHLPTAVNILQGKMTNHQTKKHSIDTVFLSIARAYILMGRKKLWFDGQKWAGRSS